MRQIPRPLCILSEYGPIPAVGLTVDVKKGALQREYATQRNTETVLRTSAG